jgi:prepilin-type N-terminal cleavage/methylation domain-containing protein
MKKNSQRRAGFTLIELLIVITIIATLLVVVFVALNPGGRLQAARDARRSSDVDSILTAVHQYVIDNNSTYPAGLSTVEQQLGTATTGCAISTGGCGVTATACLSLGTPLAKYLKSIPVDPLTSTYNAGTTGYSVLKDSNDIVTVRACGTEGTNNIYTSR